MFIQLFISDIGEVVFLFIIGAVQLRVGLFDVEGGYFIVVIRDGFTVGDESRQLVCLGIRFTLLELNFEVKL